MSPQECPALTTPPELLSKQMLTLPGSSLLKNLQLWDQEPWMEATQASGRRLHGRRQVGSWIPDSSE